MATETQSTAQTAALKLAEISRWIDEAPANAARDSEAALWARVAKVGEEVGEAHEAWLGSLTAANGRLIAALIGATGQNPRKGLTHSLDDVIEELLDTALTAVCAVEHMTGNHGHALAQLSMKIHRVYERAGLGTSS